MENTQTNTNKDLNKNANVAAPKATTGDQAADKEGFQGMIMSKIAELGDLLERAGEKVEGSGYSKIGEAIYKLGDSLEHLTDGKKSAGTQNADKKSESFGKDKPAKNDSQAV